MFRNISKLFLFSVLTIAATSCGDNGGKENENIPEPYIESISTEYDGKAVAGMPVTLIGLNFSPVASENKVLYGIGLDAVAVQVNEAAEDRLVFNAPTVSSTQLKIRVSTKGKESNSVVLEYTTAPDPVTPVEPWSDTPTLDFSKLGGTTKTLVPGVEWTAFHGTWEGQIRNINIVRTTLNEHNSLGIYYNYSDNGYLYLDEKCTFVDAVAGTNGPMACCHFVRVDGVIKRAANDQDPWVANCALTIDDGVVDIVKVRDNYKAAQLTNKTVGSGGPLLVWEGVIQDNPEWANEEFIKTTHPRTAIGLSSDGKTVVQVAVDGRWTSGSNDQRAIGMSTPLLAKLMQGLGCYKAMNFDGGGGTQMWIYGEGDVHNIVNHPHNSWPVYGTSPAVYYWIKDNEVSRRTAGNAVYIRSDLKK